MQYTLTLQQAAKNNNVPFGQLKDYILENTPSATIFMNHMRKQKEKVK